jgi:hypothetical protein
MTLNDCYTSCLKDTNCTFDPEFPPFLNVYINADQYDEDEYYECKDCYKKEAILEHLKEGSVMYDYFAKDFYLNNLAYKDSKSIGYYPSSYLDSEDEDDGSINIISFTKKQSQDIKKLLKKKNKLNIQAYELKVQAMAIVMDAQIPDGQLHIRKTSWGDWLLEGQNTQEEETSYDDDLVIVSVDAVDEAVEKRKEQKTSEAKWEKKISQMEKKFYKIIDEIDEVEKEIEKITGHSITLEDIY